MPESRYNKLCGSLRSLAHRIVLLPSQDPFRSRMEGQILSKLYDMGVLNSQAKLSDVDNRLTVAALCRRRLAVIMVTSKMAETVSAVSTALFGWNVQDSPQNQAVKFIEQGHVRVGPDNITDPAYLVTR
jgi:U3 small nucleolar ribonucleoprotein protein IMP3